MEQMWGNKMDENDSLYRGPNEGLVAWLERIVELDKLNKKMFIDTPMPQSLYEIFEEAFKASIKDKPTRPNRL